MDEVDKAQQVSSQEMEIRLQDLRQLQAKCCKYVDSWEKGPDHCEECDDVIPDARRKAVPGVIYCVECAEQVQQERIV